MNYPEIPAGNLFSSVTQYSAFLAMVASGGQAPGQVREFILISKIAAAELCVWQPRLLKQSSVELLITDQGIDTGNLRSPGLALGLFLSSGTPSTDGGMLAG